METDIICLMPGNWYELRKFNLEKTIPYDINSLKEEILSQVNDRYNKLNFIEISFFSKYAQKNIESIDFYINKEKMKCMNQFLQNEKRHPIVTFHGTTNINTVESIIKHGYIIPGMANGLNVIKAHGSAYGTGVYSSPHFEKSMGYTIPDQTKYVYIIINLLFLGVMKLIPFDSSLTSDLHTKPINGHYSDNTNTRIVYGMDQIISADPSRVVPIAVMKIKIN